ncbi:MAG TPA: DNA cytosine methyltransferase [bacterium]|nr:DNA cytosine methyltransferase [bacterium]
MKKLKILCACEFSGIVRDAFIKRGHDAVSCDLLPTERLGPHIQGDVLKILDDGWDLMIAHPPCKYICNGGNNWLNRRPDLDWRGNRELGAKFFIQFINAPINKIAVENPIGCMSSKYRKPNQIVRPWWFGNEYNKDICLWLKNLPCLEKTDIINPPYKKLDFWSSKRNPNGRSLKSITFQGIADAMAEQWG